MKEFNINDGRNEFKMILPTKLNEISNDYLLGVTNHVNIADYHALIAIVYRCKLPEIISTARKKKDLATAIVPVFIKANVNTNNLPLFNDIKCGDKLIIAGTDIERGYKVNCPKNFINIDNIISIYSCDNEFAKGVMLDQNYYYFVDFKLVPASDIKGFYSSNVDKEFINPFIVNNTPLMN